MQEESYFVCSDEDKPIKICFNWESAFNTKALFIDIFNSDGERVDSYVFDTNVKEYSNEF